MPASNLNPLFPIASLRPHIAAGCTIVTSNLRLARVIREAWRLDCLARNLDTWDEPTILPLESWLESRWQDLVDAAFPPTLAGHCAAAHQETILWERVIDGDDQLPATANPGNFAELARRGWKLVRQWQIADSTLDNSLHTGAQFLRRWGNAVETLLNDAGLITSEQRAAIVRAGFDHGILPRVDSLVLVGFQTLTPLHKNLLEKAAANLIHHQAMAANCRPMKTSGEDIDGEIALAADWAKAIIDRDGCARVGIVIPQLTALQTRVERIFRNRLDPTWTLPNNHYRPPPFNISAARPLAEAPLVAAALQLLALLTRELAVPSYCDLLNSPFWGDGQRGIDTRCRAQKSLLDLGLHQYPTARFRLLLDQLESNRDGDVPENALSVRLAKLATLQRTWPSRQSFRQWRDCFTQALEILGWPGPRPLDSLEFQQLNQWQEVLNSLGDLDRVSTAVAVDDGLSRLSSLAADSPFHAESPDSQIQILGTLEAAGLRFDHLWVMNLDDRHWPEAPSPHPLLPVSLQRRLAMPKASPERELHLSRELFDLFAHSAPEVVFSYCRREGDVHLQPSVFLENLADYQSPTADSRHPWWPELLAASDLERLEDSQAPAYQPESGKLSGGSRFLADQAQCPFNAFARWRLGAQSLAESITGLPPTLRGNLVHGSLEIFWRDMADSQALHQLDDGQRRQRLTDAIAAAMQQYFRRQHGLVQEQDYGHRHLELERQRLARLLDDWLHIEMARAPFAVAHSELNSQLTLDGLTLSLRLDRVDRLADGRLVIIDYKTGQSGIGNLGGATGDDRLLEPQLPVYALAMQATSGEPLAAVTYAKINIRTLAFDGLADSADLLPGCQTLEKKGLPDNWSETLSQWQRAIDELVAEIRAGNAALVYHSRDAGKYSADLLPLNRLHDVERLGQ